MSVPVTLEALDLAALLCSRVCHDLISPTGAIVNGLEVLEESDDEDTRNFALDLIRKSAKTASARLQFCRIAFGAAGSSTTQIDLGDAEALARGFVEAERVRLLWNLARAAVPKNRARLLMNMILVAAQAIPRGGVLTVEGAGLPEAMTFRVSARGLNARIAEQVPALLDGRPDNGTVDAQGIQPYYTGLLARAIGLDATIATDGDAVVIAVRQPVPAPRPVRRRVDWLRDQPLAGKSLTGKPLTGKPLTGKPLTDKPLSDKPLSDKPLSDKPLSDKSLSDKSLTAAQPLAGPQLIGKPLTAQPLAGPQLIGKPLTAQPVTGPHLIGKPLTAQPVTGPHLTGPPLNGKPMNGQHVGAAGRLAPQARSIRGGIEGERIEQERP